MKKQDSAEGKLPPYIPFKTLRGFVQKLKEAVVPERVDSSLLRTYSGSVGRKLTAALRFLRLIEDGGHTTEKLHRLVKSHGTPEWSVMLSEVIGDAYRDVIGDLNLKAATPAQLQERFKEWGVEGGSVSACVAFYVGAQRASGVELSPHILNKPRGRGNRNGSRMRRPRSETEAPARVGTSDTLPAIDAAGTVRFAFPLPDKAAVTLFLPKDLDPEDWTMIDSMVRAYIQRREKGK